VAITLATLPTYALPSDEVRVVVTAGGGGNFARVWCTDAPEGSALRAELDAAGTSARVEVFAVAPDDPDPRIPLDAPGAYTFAAQEYTRQATTQGGGYAGDPNGYQSETKVGSETTVTLYAGERLTTRLGSARFGFATLVLYVWADTVRATDNQNHPAVGVTPAIINPTTEAADLAARDATVATSLDALADKTAAALVLDAEDIIEEICDELFLHMTNAGGSYHTVADTDNDDLIRDKVPPATGTKAGIAESVRLIHQYLSDHMRNLPGTAGDYHSELDYANAPAVTAPAGPSDMASTMATLADLHRVYEAHRADATAHAAADSTNVITTALPPLLTLHSDYLDALRQLSPSAPSTANAAAVVLVHSAGFVPG
jgi:hypothetical protein